MYACLTAELINQKAQHAPIDGKQVQVFLFEVKKNLCKPDETFLYRLQVLAWLSVEKFFVLIDDKMNSSVLNFDFEFRSQNLHDFAGFNELLFIQIAHVLKIERELINNNSLQMRDYLLLLGYNLLYLRNLLIRGEKGCQLIRALQQGMNLFELSLLHVGLKIF